MSLSEERVLVSEVKQVGGVEYAAATGGNLLVSQTVDFVAELTLAASGIHKVCMRVAESRQHIASAGVNHTCEARFGGKLLHAAPGSYTLAVDSEPGIVHPVGALHLYAAQRLVGLGAGAENGCDILNQQHSGRGYCG